MIHGKKTSFLAMLMIGCMVAGLVGCAKTDVSEDSFQRVKKGMSVSEVEQILGKGSEGEAVGGQVGKLKGEVAVYVWESGDKKITVTFEDGKVVDKTQIGLTINK